MSDLRPIRPCPFCGRDTSGQRGHITPRELPREDHWRTFAEPLTPHTRDLVDVRTCSRGGCIYAAQVLDLKQIETDIKERERAQ